MHSNNLYTTVTSMWICMFVEKDWDAIGQDKII